MSLSDWRKRLQRVLGLSDEGDGRSMWQRVFLRAPEARSATQPSATQAALERARRPRAPAEREHDFASRLMRRLGVDTDRWGARFEKWSAHPWLDLRVVQWIVVAAAALVFWLTMTTPLNLLGQALLFLILWGMALLIRRVPGTVPTLLLVLLALLASCRYGYWRLTESIDLEPGWETFLGWSLLGAEMYAFLIMVLGFVQSVFPLKRQTMALTEDRSQWPTVDILIPTYHEPLSVVEPTVLAARNVDWPADKLNVYILDDGRRDELEAFARDAGVHYLRRPDNSHAKAGNLNHALTVSKGQYVAFFDCDHMPTRTFLTASMGWLVDDPKCAMVQTPQHFFSPDPFERNLDTFRRIPNEGKLFYGIVQDGNDLWNAAFFCGSCAVVRRSALEDIGGVATDTVTEDAHTALKLHRRGYTTAYLGSTQAAGLATESLSQHIAQRTRWARGMAQIFRIDNPLFGRGLNLMQRLCYSNAMLHFFYGLPRLIFLTAPLAYLFFELHIIRASALSILVFALPHVVLPHIANAHINGPHRHNFWAEVYETVLAWYVAWPTTLAFLNPSLGRFNVTAKGGLIEQDHFDWRISRPYLALVLVNMIGVGIGLFRLFSWNSYEAGTVLLNLLWTVYNLAMLGAAIGVARERRQVRLAHRVASHLQVQLLLADGSRLPTVSEDYSLGGLGVGLARSLPLKMGDELQVALQADDGEHIFPVRVTSLRGERLGLAFEPLDIEQRADLIQCTLARPDAWTEWQQRYDTDQALQGLKEISLLALQSYGALLGVYWASVRRGGTLAARRWRARWGSAHRAATQLAHQQATPPLAPAGAAPLSSAVDRPASSSNPPAVS
ncbi:UDP-forming cellulose synthase catalytic subunit [soil metagenome]